jgi:hypothetical protein
MDLALPRLEKPGSRHQALTRLLAGSESVISRAAIYHLSLRR